MRLLATLVVHILHLIQHRSIADAGIIPCGDGIDLATRIVDFRNPPGVANCCCSQRQCPIMNLQPRPVVVKRMPAATLICHQCLLALAVVAVCDHRRQVPATCATSLRELRVRCGKHCGSWTGGWPHGPGSSVHAEQERNRASRPVAVCPLLDSPEVLRSAASMDSRADMPISGYGTSAKAHDQCPLFNAAFREFLKRQFVNGPWWERPA